MSALAAAGAWSGSIVRFTSAACMVFSVSWRASPSSMRGPGCDAEVIGFWLEGPRARKVSVADARERMRASSDGCRFVGQIANRDLRRTPSTKHHSELSFLRTDPAREPPDERA